MATELGRPFKLSQPAISRHLKVLEQAGLIRRRQVGTKRLCSLQTPALDELQQWLGLLRAALEANYSRLDALLASLEDNTETRLTNPPIDHKPTSKKHHGT